MSDNADIKVDVDAHLCDSVFPLKFYSKEVKQRNLRWIGQYRDSFPRRITSQSLPRWRVSPCNLEFADFLNRRLLSEAPY
jgi:hypothetical protein